MGNTDYEVIIIGGSYAGLSAAMTLGRAIRNVLVIDSGAPCNIQTPQSHNFLTQDGSTPASIARLAKSQVMEYPTIAFKDAVVNRVSGQNNAFRVSTTMGESISTAKIIFATGLKDLMPDIKGFAECWGISVIHCPYCHGYEYKNDATGIFANGGPAFDFSRLINNWTKDLTIFTNGKSTISDLNMQQLVKMNVSVVEKPLQEIWHQDGHLSQIVFTDGSNHKLNALYARLPFEQNCKAISEIGCSINDSGYVEVDEFQKTSVPGIYAAGDNCSMFRSVSSAVATGSKAAAMTNHELINEG